MTMPRVLMHVCSVFPSVFLVFQHMLSFRLSRGLAFLGVFYRLVSQDTSAVLVECFSQRGDLVKVPTSLKNNYNVEYRKKHGIVRRTVAWHNAHT